jgi:hypothetical protein
VAALSQGVKFDQNKPRMDLIPPEVFEEMGKVLAFGSEKYEARNWEKGMAWGRCHAAALRHLVAWSRGEDLDPETGLPHLAHAATNIAFLLAYQQRGMRDGFDDRAPHFTKLSPPASRPTLSKSVLPGGPVAPLSVE